MRIAAASFAAIAMAGCSATGSNAQLGDMFSADAALKIVFDQVCVPAILEGKPVETLARAQSMVEIDASGANAGAGDREWRLATLGYASVMAWADGTCMISVERGDPARHSTHLISTMNARGVKLKKGQTTQAAGGGANAAWCTSDARPVILNIITPTQRGARAAIVANLFKATEATPAFCRSS